MIIKKRRVDGVSQRYHVRPKWQKKAGIKNKVRLIRIDDIEPIETLQDKFGIEEIQASGPIRKPVRVHGKYAPGQKYQLWDGHHRYLAAKRRGDKYIPAIIDLNISSHSFWRKHHAHTIESRLEKARRIRIGYTKLVEVSARKLKEMWDKHHPDENLAWNQNRLDSARKRMVYDSYARVYYHDKKIDIDDGRHRIAAAAERDHNIIISVRPKFPKSVLGALR